MSTTALCELRDTLAPTARELAEAGMSSREMAVEFNRRYPELVQKAQGELVILALVQQVGGVLRRKPAPSFSPMQSDLFKHLDVSICIPKEAGRSTGKINKRSFKCSLEELDAYIDEASRERRKVKKIVDELREVRKIIAPFMKPGMLVEDGLAAAEKFQKPLNNTAT